MLCLLVCTVLCVIVLYCAISWCTQQYRSIVSPGEAGGDERGIRGLDLVGEKGRCSLIVIRRRRNIMILLLIIIMIVKMRILIMIMMNQHNVTLMMILMITTIS